MKKIISYSLYGNSPMYCIGAIKNSKIIKEKLPEWKCLIWYDKTVPNEIVEELSIQDNVILRDMTGSDIPGMYWRFLCLDDNQIEVFCVRDTDSRITDREIFAIKDWLKKDKTLHLMRDHPHHNYPVMGGMWGFRNDKSSWPIKEKLYHWLSNENRFTFKKMQDMDFIGSIYSDYYDDCVVHDDWNRCKNSIKFPTKRDDNMFFVGEIFDENDVRSDHWKLLEKSS